MPWGDYAVGRKVSFSVPEAIVGVKRVAKRNRRSSRAGRYARLPPMETVSVPRGSGQVFPEPPQIGYGARSRLARAGIRPAAG